MTPPKPLFFHLEASKYNLKITLKSSFIKWTRVGGISTFSFNFKHIVITKSNASLNN
jgi:hypothetical protein